MGLPEQIGRYMSLREPQRESLCVLDEISTVLDYKTARLEAVQQIASDKSRHAKPVEFDTEFPSFCFALATGVGKTRLMGGCMYYLWRSKGYRNFFILAPNLTIYDKLRAELLPSHAKYMFIGLSDFPTPEVYDGDNYLRFRPEQMVIGNPANVFIFNIGKIFTRGDTDFKFHRFNEVLGDSFSAILQGMDDLVVLMDESHRYRGPASITAINHLRPALGLEFTATPKHKGNVVYSFTLAEAMGRFVKTPTVVTRTNLTTADEEEIERLKLIDGMTLHEKKKGKVAEYCQANGLPSVKPFVLVSTKDTTHASKVRELIESDDFCEGRYRGKVIEIHSGKTGTESDENVQRLLAVEQPTSTVEIVIHVNMLKEGWDVKNLYTIIPLRATISEILAEQTIGRGLRLPFGTITGDPDLDALDIVSHDQYAKLIEAAKDNPLFKFKELTEAELRPVKRVPVMHKFVDLEDVLDRLQRDKHILFTAELTDEQRLNEVVERIVAEEAAKHERELTAVAEAGGEAVEGKVAQGALFEDEGAGPKVRPFDPETLRRELTERLRDFAHANIDVPNITIDTCPEVRIEPFDVKVNIGPLELVDQKILSHDLATGRDRVGETVEVLDIDNPRAFLAGRVIDSIDELDVAHDKETVLTLVDRYLDRLGEPADRLGKIVHLYRDAIIGDLRNQIDVHLSDNTRVEVSMRGGFVKFKRFDKTILERDGIVHYSETVPRSDIRKYLFEGFTKSFFPQVAFDSTPEKDFAALLERDATVLKWIRPPDGDVPIAFRGRKYTPDFIVETADAKYMAEIKGRRDLEPEIDQEVHDKAIAAIRWCEAASTQDRKRWEYRLIPENAVGATLEFRFVLSQAVNVA